MRVVRPWISVFRAAPEGVWVRLGGSFSPNAIEKPWGRLRARLSFREERGGQCLCASKSKRRVSASKTRAHRDPLFLVCYLSVPFSRQARLGLTAAAPLFAGVVLANPNRAGERLVWCLNGCGLSYTHRMNARHDSCHADRAVRKRAPPWEREAAVDLLTSRP